MGRKDDELDDDLLDDLEDLGDDAWGDEGPEEEVEGDWDALDAEDEERRKQRERDIDRLGGEYDI